MYFLCRELRGVSLQFKQNTADKYFFQNCHFRKKTKRQMDLIIKQFTIREEEFCGSIIPPKLL